MKRFLLSIILILSFKVFSSDDKPPVAVSVTCHLEKCQVGALVSAVKETPVFQSPGVSKEVGLFKKGTEAFILEYQQRSFPKHLKQDELDIYILESLYSDSPAKWEKRIWQKGKEKDVHGVYDKDYKRLRLIIDDKSYDLEASASINTADPEIEYWIKVKQRSGLSGWVKAEMTSNPNLSVLPWLEDEEAESLKRRWESRNKIKFLGVKELLKKLSIDSYFNFGSVYRPKKINGFTYPEAAFHTIAFDDDSEQVFKFKTCSSLKKLLLVQVPQFTIGNSPYEVRYNHLFIKTDKGFLTENFMTDCLALAENNTYECPDYTRHIETVLSKVGPLLTIEHSSSGGGDCGPSYSGSRVRSYDLRTGKETTIFEFFDRESVSESLRTDPLIQEKIKRNPELAKDIDALITKVSLNGFGIFEPKLYNGKVRIRWSLPREGDQCGMCTNSYSTIGLDVLPLPWFKDELAKLDPKKEKYLYQSEKK